MKKPFTSPHIKVINYSALIICSSISSPAERDHGDGPGNGKGWGPGGKPKSSIFENDLYE